MTAPPSRRTFLGTAALAGDGIRIIGEPGGSAHFTSIAELAIFQP